MKRDIDHREDWDDLVYAPDRRVAPRHDIPLILFSAIIVIVLALFILFWPLGGPVKAQEDNCQGGAIKSECCCTNSCCRSVSSTAIQATGPDQYLIVASGQKIKKTDWSPDGTIILCQCDMIEGKWTVHPKAHARCLYMPMPNS